MKTWEVILKVITALLAVAGIIFVIITYGDKIVAWFKRMFGKSEVILYDEEETAPAEEEAEAAEEADFAE